MATTMLTIERSEAREIEDQPGWILLYGRRKVGKTFMLRNFIHHDVFVSVRRDRISYATGLPVTRVTSPETLVDLTGPVLRRGGTVVVDEFQRLPGSFLDEVATFHPDGRLILSGSSLAVVSRVLGVGSPMLGLTSVHHLRLVRPTDVLRSLLDRPPQTALPFAAYLRDPWLVPKQEGRRSLEPFLLSVMGSARTTVPALIGEVFTESERYLSQVYEGVIRALGARLWRPGDIAARLHESGLVSTGGSTQVTQYLANLMEMGIVDRVAVFGRSRPMAYRLASNVMDTFYYLADKHRIDEEDRPAGDIRDNLQASVSRAMERFVGELFAQLMEGQVEYSFDPEVDFIITRGRRRKPVLAGEVRWGRFSAGDVRSFKAKVDDLECRKVFIVPRARTPEEVDGVEVLDARAVVDLALCHRPPSGE